MFTSPQQTAGVSRIRSVIGLSGLFVASTFFIWLIVGWFGWVPTMVEVFGIPGMRTPASMTVAGLLIAAISFWEV